MKETEKKKRGNPLTPVTIILSVCTLAAIFLCIAIIMLNRDNVFGGKKEEVTADSEIPEIGETYTREEVDEMVNLARIEGENLKATEIKQYIRSEAEGQSPSLATILRTLFTESVVYPGDGRFYFEDISDSIKANPYERDHFVTDENGYRYYVDGEATQSILCIDISAHQGSVDWQAVAASGVQAAIIRAGYRGYGSGKMVEDEYVKGNLEGARVNNIKAGVYFFSQAINEAEIDEEVNTLLELVAPYSIEGPIAIDVEKLDADTARGNALTQEERTALVKRFCEKVKAAGYQPMIYGNAYSLFHMLNYNELTEYPIWYAYYSDSLYFPYDLAVWQYSSTGKVNGINGNVDLNVMFIPSVDAPAATEDNG
jgi:GH25 family lysozyme M1 (1,4-beta-N-acetylmuramidase)